MIGTKMDVDMAIRRERARLDALLDEADNLAERRRRVLSEARKIEELLGIKAPRRWRKGKEDPLWLVAQTILNNSGRPTHVNEILREVNKSRSLRREDPASKVALVQAMKGKPATFVLVYRYTWGLRSWATPDEQAETSASQ